MRRLLFLCLTVLAFLLAARPLRAQNYFPLYQFPICDPAPSCPEGRLLTTLIQSADGNFYGTTAAAGPEDTEGTLFLLSPLGTYQLLYTFCTQTNCPDGSTPQSLILGTDGNFYGITQGGYLPASDPASAGTIFKYSPTTGQLTTLYTFCSQPGCADGIYPNLGLIQGTDGKLYGTTPQGGNTYNGGVAYSLTTSGVYTVLHDFCTLQATNSNGDVTCTDASNPTGGLLQASDGNFYGTSIESYASDYYGFVAYLISYFKMTPSGTLTTYPFCCSGLPNGNLLETSSGLIIGVTSYNNGVNTNQPAPYNSPYSVLYSLSGGQIASLENTTYNDFLTPVLASNGSLLTYEVPDTELISITPSGAITPLYNTSSEETPTPVVQGQDGRLYLTSGIAQGGAVYEFLPATQIIPPVQVAASSTQIELGQSTVLSWSVNNAYSDTMKQCGGFLNGAPVGLVATTGSFTFTPAEVGSYTGGITCGGVESGSVIINVVNANGSLLNTATMLSALPSPIAYGSAFTVTARVKRTTGTGFVGGNVSFYTKGNTLLGTLPLLYGSASLPVGAQFSFPTASLTAVYSGDSADNASTSPTVTLVFDATSNTSLTASPTLVEAGQNVTLSANIGSLGAGLGTVTFYSGSYELGTAVPNQSGIATFTASTTGVATGIYPVTAVYSGTPNISGSTSSPVYVTVNAQ